MTFGGQYSTLKSIKESIENGRLTTFKELVFSEAFSNLTEQADYLLDKGYFIAAGVLYRAVLEEKLRRLCESNECMPDKDRPTINDYNMSLYKGEKYDKMTMKLVEAMATIGNNATHAKEEILIEHVRKLKSDLEFFLPRF